MANFTAWFGSFGIIVFLCLTVLAVLTILMPFFVYAIMRNTRHLKDILASVEKTERNAAAQRESMDALLHSWKWNLEKTGDPLGGNDNLALVQAETREEIQRLVILQRQMLRAYGHEPEA